MSLASTNQSKRNGAEWGDASMPFALFFFPSLLHAKQIDYKRAKSVLNKDAAGPEEKPCVVASNNY
jgi:hypothetical protein